MSEHDLPLLPLILADVPGALVRALGQEGVPVERFEPQTAAGRFVLFDSSRAACPELAPDQVAIDVHGLRGSSTEDPFALLDDEQSRRVRWWVGHLAVSEEVSRVDKRAARQQLLAGVRTLVETAGGIWLRTAAFPYPYRSAFNFRLDYDEYQAEDFATVLDIVARHQECFSHFVCAASFENQPQALDRLRGLDVGSHGYWHHTYDDLLENRRNVARGVAALRAHGIEPSGFVAPHGRFNRGLLAVLQELGVGHSSEFGLAYDELPFYPVDSSVLQVPVHPICLGICLEAAGESGGTGAPALRAAADVLAEYFRWIATAKYQAGEPIFLYGHPEYRLGRFPQVLRGVLETVSQFAAVWKTTLSEFAAWWRARAALRMRVYRDGDSFVIFVDEHLPGYRYGVEYWRGEHSAPMPLDETMVRFSPAALVFQGRKPRDLPTLVRLDQPIGLRSQLLRYLDWEKVTPVDEIGTHHWRGWVKRTLRRIRE